MMGLRAGSRRWRVRLAFTGAIALAAALVAVAGAQSGGSSSDRPVLHEQVEGLTDFRWDPIDAAGATGPGTIPGTPGTPLVPGASGAEPPPTSAEMPTDVPMPPRPDAHVSDVPSPAFHPDLDTNSATLPRDPNPAGILWSPSPGPYLRQQVYDVVRADGTLDSPQARPEELRPAEPPIGAADTERFIGRARLVVSDDMPVQLPTPAPDYRAAIVGGATDGDRLATDRVGNLFFVPGPARGERELVLVVEADELVFGGTLDGSATIDAAPQVPQTALPETLRGAAKRVAERIGVSRDLPMETALRLLAAYFRSFEPGPPPAGTMGTDYELLALGRVGLCRHRAYAFVVTAQALGIRARMPVSRLHAWVEALVPVPGVNGPRWLWRRIDLGGAYGETDQEVAEVPAHVPDLPDPLPWPRGAKPTPSAGFPGSPQPGTGAGTSPDATDPTADDSRHRADRTVLGRRNDYRIDAAGFSSGNASRHAAGISPAAAAADRASGAAAPRPERATRNFAGARNRTVADTGRPSDCARTNRGAGALPVRRNARRRGGGLGAAARGRGRSISAVRVGDLGRRPARRRFPLRHRRGPLLRHAHDPRRD
jgi:hypothetical protein